MNISKFTGDDEFRPAILKKINNSIPEPKYLGEYKDWAKRKKAGHSISQIVAHTEASRRVVTQGLYAMDLINSQSTHVKNETEFGLIWDYYMEDMTTTELAEKYDVHKRKPSWFTRLPALRLMIDFDPEDVEAEEFTKSELKEIRNRLRNDESNKTKTKDEDDYVRDWKRKKGKIEGNYTARVKETTQV